jgi:hypothetical protein
MKRRDLALFALLALTVSTVASLQVSDLASANYFPPPSIEIGSPNSFRVYNDSFVRLYVRVNALPDESNRILYIKYCLDGGANVTVTNLTRTNGEGYWTSTPGVIASGNAFGVETSLDNLSEGNHTLTVYSHAADGKEMSKSRDFTVDYDYVPPQNPFGLPDNLPNGTSTLPPTITQRPEGIQTETPMPTTNIFIQPLESCHILFLVIAVTAVSVLAPVLYLRRKSHKVGEPL